MASTYSSLKFELIGTGEQTGTWGTTTNTNLGTAIEEAIVGRATANFTSDANLTLTLTDTNATQVARNFVLNVTSSVSLTVTRDLIVPGIEKPYIIQNNTTGSQAIRVIVAGASVTVPNGKTAFVYNDNTDIKVAFNYTPTLDVAALTGGTLSFTGDGTFSGTGQVKLPAGTTGERSGSPASGMLRFNTSANEFEGYNGTAWGSVGGGNITNKGLWENANTISANYTIGTNNNALSSGPITVSSGVTVTVPSGSNWVVV